MAIHIVPHETDFKKYVDSLKIENERDKGGYFFEEIFHNNNINSDFEVMCRRSFNQMSSRLEERLTKAREWLKEMFDVSALNLDTNTFCAARGFDRAIIIKYQDKVYAISFQRKEDESCGYKYWEIYSRTNIEGLL